MISAVSRLPTAVRLTAVTLFFAALSALIGLIVSELSPDRVRISATVDSALAPVPEAIFGDGGGLYAETVQTKSQIIERFESLATQKAVIDRVGLASPQAAQALEMLTTSLRVQMIEDGRIEFEFVAPSEEIGRRMVKAYLELEREIQQPIANRRVEAAQGRVKALEDRLMLLDRLLAEIDVTPDVELGGAKELTQRQRLEMTLLATDSVTRLAEKALEARDKTQRMALTLRSSLLNSRDIAVSEVSVMQLRPELQRAIFFTVAMGIMLIGFGVLAVWFIFRGGHADNAKEKSDDGGRPAEIG